MPWARASALHRHLECPAASWLPRAERGKWHQGYLVAADSLVRPVGPDPEDDSVLAEWGTQMHLAKEGSPDAADPWESWMTPHRERLWPTGLGVHEKSWAYDCRSGLITLHRSGCEQCCGTGCVMDTDVDPATVQTESDLLKDCPGCSGDADAWKKSRGPSEVTGTTDWHATLPSGEPWVDDLKTGWPKPAPTTPQMLCYALIASKVSGYSTVRISVTHWRRGWDYPERYWQQVGPATLEAFDEELRAAWRKAVAGGGPRAGSHCRWCPSAMVCPTVTG